MYKTWVKQEIIKVYEKMKSWSVLKIKNNENWLVIVCKKLCFHFISYIQFSLGWYFLVRWMHLCCFIHTSNFRSNGTYLYTGWGVWCDWWLKKRVRASGFANWNWSHRLLEIKEYIKTFLTLPLNSSTKLSNRNVMQVTCNLKFSSRHIFKTW